jgi:GAF domain-containing protein
MNSPLYFQAGKALLPGNEKLAFAIGVYIDLAVEASGASGGSFYVCDTNRRVLVPFATLGIPVEYTNICGDVALGDQCCGRAAMHKRPWIVSDMLTDPLFAAAREAALNSPIRAGFSIPVLDGAGQCIGVLACVFREPHTPTTDDILRNETWADLIGHSISDAKRLRSAENISRSDESAITQ